MQKLTSLNSKVYRETPKITQAILRFKAEKINYWILRTITKLYKLRVYSIGTRTNKLTKIKEQVQKQTFPTQSNLIYQASDTAVQRGKGGLFNKQCCVNRILTWEDPSLGPYTSHHTHNQFHMDYISQSKGETVTVLRKNTKDTFKTLE